MVSVRPLPFTVFMMITLAKLMIAPALRRKVLSTKNKHLFPQINPIDKRLTEPIMRKSLLCRRSCPCNVSQCGMAASGGATDI